MSFNLLIKEVQNKLRKRICFPANTCIDWQLILDSVEREFSVQRNSFQLSLNHGKTYIEADLNTTVSDLGLVSGDILTLHILPNAENGEISADSSLASEQYKPSNTTGDHRSNSAITENCTASYSCEPKEVDPISSEATCKDITTDSLPLDHSCMSEQMMEVDRQAVNSYLLSPILLRDVTSDGLLPSSFNKLLSDNGTTDPVNLLVLTLHTLLIESGFELISKSGTETSILEQICYSPDLYKMHYSHIVHPDSKVTVACVKMNRQLAIHGVVQPSGNLSLILSVLKYVNQSGIQKEKLPELSNYFKDMFVAPLIMTMKEVLNIDALPPLLNLPYEMMMLIFYKLDYKSVCQLGQTCSQLSRVYKNNTIWKRLYCRSGFSALRSYFEHKPTRETHWYEEYKMRIKERCRILMPPMMFDPPRAPLPGLPHFPFFPPFEDDPVNRGIIHPMSTDVQRQNRSNVNPLFRGQSHHRRTQFPRPF